MFPKHRYDAVAQRAAAAEHGAADREEFDGTIARLFDSGHREEARILQDLKDIGCQVWDKDPATDRQFAIESHNGHVKGHLDAVVLGLPEAPKTWHVFDAKTVKRKKLDELKKNGFRQTFPRYYAQAQGYMGGMKIDVLATAAPWLPQGETPRPLLGHNQPDPSRLLVT
jgi:hypothetical protein